MNISYFLDPSVQILLFLTYVPGEIYPDHDILVTACAVPSRPALALKPQFLAAVAVGRDSKVDRTIQGGNGYPVSQNGLFRMQQYSVFHIVSFDLKNRMRQEMHLEVQVTPWPSADPFSTLTFQADTAAFKDPDRYLHLQGPGLTN